jgi:exopolyphosphatase/pppGpp-phosphohydrolase
MVIASIDIGSNTILLLIAEVMPEELKITPLRDEQRIPRISEGLTRKGI